MFLDGVELFEGSVKAHMLKIFNLGGTRVGANRYVEGEPRTFGYLLLYDTFPLLTIGYLMLDDTFPLLTIG